MKTTLPSNDISANLSQRSAWAGDQPISKLMKLALANPELVSLAAGVRRSSDIASPRVRANLREDFGGPA